MLLVFEFSPTGKIFILFHCENFSAVGIIFLLLWGFFTAIRILLVSWELFSCCENSFSFVGIFLLLWELFSNCDSFSSKNVSLLLWEFFCYRDSFPLVDFTLGKSSLVNYAKYPLVDYEAYTYVDYVTYTYVDYVLQAIFLQSKREFK